jgi:hypothetical protein
MKTIAYISAIALLVTIAACSDSGQQRSNVQCSPYDPQCRISQAPAGTEKLLPQDQSIQQMRQIPMSQ